MEKLRAILRLVEGALKAKPCALQVAMFFRRQGECQLLNAIQQFSPDAVYFDSIRLVDYIQLVRRRLPSSYVICDFDDLMSRRASMLRTENYPLCAGYLAKSIPKVAVNVLNAKVLRNIVLFYEGWSLRMHERLALACSDAVTLVSSADAEVLTGGSADASRTKVHVIAPPIDFAMPVRRPSSPIRFVFIGSDSQLQNRLAIHYLVATWKRLGVESKLVVYGKMFGQYDAPPNVHFAGFAGTLGEVYTKNSIALCPVFLRGGIKSKVLEAISYGCIPIGNEAAFEGLNFHDDALAMNARRFEQFLQDPEADLANVVEAAGRFAAYCEQNHSVKVFSRRWGELLAAARTAQRSTVRHAPLRHDSGDRYPTSTVH